MSGFRVLERLDLHGEIATSCNYYDSEDEVPRWILDLVEAQIPD